MSKSKTTIGELYPELSDDELTEVERNLDRYVELIFRIYERLESEGKMPLNDEDKTE